MVSPSPAFDGPKGHAGEVRGAPCCADDVARALLVPYAVSHCREDDAIAFEAHMLSCEACFQDLKCLDRASTLILEARERGFELARTPAEATTTEALTREERLRKAKREDARGHGPQAADPAHRKATTRSGPSTAPGPVEGQNSKRA